MTEATRHGKPNVAARRAAASGSEQNAPTVKPRARTPLRHVTRAKANTNAPQSPSLTCHTPIERAGGTVGCSAGGSTGSRAALRISAVS